MKIGLSLIVAGIAMSLQASAATVSPAAGASPTTGPASASSSACSRFQPGHYVHISDDRGRGSDGLAALRTFLSKDVTNFKGVQYGMTWGMIETSPGVYDFSRLDAALAQVKAKGKYLLLFFKDRTFHTGCDSEFLPSYLEREESHVSSRACFAKIWEQPTMDQMIRVLKAIAVRYKDDPHFLGISLPETTIAALSMKGRPEVRLALYEQLKRAYPAVHSVAPNLIIHQMVNWPSPTMKSLYDLTDQLVALGGGGAIGWPDTVPSHADDWGWYRLGREYSKKLAVIPHVQTPAIPSSLEATDQIYSFLVDDINAHMIVWATWHKDMGNAYLTEVVIPTVNKHGGAVKNTTCPW
jgi:hypothetical protein